MTRLRSPARMALVVYGTVTLVSVAVAVALGRNPLVVPPWLPISGPLAHASSAAAGVVLAVATVAATRAFVRRWGWARSLHQALRPTVRDEADGTLLVLGVASGVAEELLFRGLLVPAIGLVLSSLAFGALHQLRGRERWVWAAWAAIMGALFGALFLATGSLVGPILAHAVINVKNLTFLRDNDTEPPKRRRLGGLLERV